jgi:hypothetical protein
MQIVIMSAEPAGAVLHNAQRSAIRFEILASLLPFLRVAGQLRDIGVLTEGQDQPAVGASQSLDGHCLLFSLPDAVLGASGEGRSGIPSGTAIRFARLDGVAIPDLGGFWTEQA